MKNSKVEMTVIHTCNLSCE